MLAGAAVPALTGLGLEAWTGELFLVLGTLALVVAGLGFQRAGKRALAVIGLGFGIVGLVVAILGAAIPAALFLGTGALGVGLLLSRPPRADRPVSS